VDYLWPTRQAEAKVNENDVHQTRQRIITYVEGGKLIQIMAVAYPEPHSIKWKLGGNIQLLVRHIDRDDFGKEYYTQQHDSILTVGCSLKIALDVQVFVDQIPQLPRQHTMKPIRRELHPGNFTNEGAEFNWSDNSEIILETERIRYIIAIFSLRNMVTNPDPTFSPPPQGEEIERRIGLSKSAQDNPLAQALEENGSAAQLIGIHHIVTRHIEQLLSVAALPFPNKRIYLLKDFSEHFGFTFECCL